VKCCYKCKKRTLNCHDSCEKYQEYKKKLDIARENRTKENNYIGYAIEAIERMKMRR